MKLQRYMDLLEQLWPLHRTLLSDDTDKAFEIIHSFSRNNLGLSSGHILMHEFPSGSELSTWVVPEKYTLKDYHLKQLGDSERTLIDRTHISLSIAEYSQPLEETMEWDELKEHLFYSERRPNAIPFVFKFFYRNNFGFCLPKNVYDTIDRGRKFHARIDSEFTDGALKCMEVVLPGKSDDTLLVMSNICHPHQVNDSITGAINNLMLIEHFMKTKTYHTLRFGFWPETIGAMAYFTRYRDRISLFKYAVFTEMLGTGGRHALQFSRQENTLIDRVAQYVLSMHDCDYYSGRFSTVLRNDERISNGVNLDIPTISVSRYPYPEYHTSDDNPSIIDMANILESWEITRDILTVLDENRTLIPGDFIGQPFLTRYGLFYEPIASGGDPSRNYNKMMEDIFSYSDGVTSLFDIAHRFDYPWEDVKTLAQRLVDHELFKSRRS